jgi:hypothetical protein
MKNKIVSIMDTDLDHILATNTQYQAAISNYNQLVEDEQVKEGVRNIAYFTWHVAILICAICGVLLLAYIALKKKKESNAAFQNHAPANGQKLSDEKHKNADNLKSIQHYQTTQDQNVPPPLPKEKSAPPVFSVSNPDSRFMPKS